MESLSKARIEALVGTKIKNLNLYIRALTHKSALKKYEILKDDYETLEFMGDSVLGFVITKWLFDKFEKQKEGFLTRARTKIVRSETLAGFAREMGIGDLVLMDDKGMNNGWNNNSKILEDCFEALVGALYLDLGMIAARDFILNIIENAHISLEDDNYKDQMMRYCQASKFPQPEYIVLSLNRGIFTVKLIMNGQTCGHGSASTKKQAEQNAAQMALKTMNICVPSYASKGPDSY
jgi:ribonuclease III